MEITTKSIIYLCLKRVLLAIILCLPVRGLAQYNKPGSIYYLNYKSGFNGLKLGSSIGNIPNYKLAYLDGDNKLDADSCLRYEYRDSTMLTMENGLQLDMIGLRTYKNKLVNIYVFFKRADGYRILNSFLTAFGNCTSRPNDYDDVYNWDSSNIGLSLRYQLQADLGVAIFTDKTFEKELIANKVRALSNTNYYGLSALYSGSE